MPAETRKELIEIVVTFVALLALATLSLGLSFLHWPTGDLVVSLLIAAAKMLGVLLFFMELARRRFTTGFVVVVSIAMLALLVGLSAADVATRQTFPARPEPTAGQSFYRR